MEPYRGVEHRELFLIGLGGKVRALDRASGRVAWDVVLEDIAGAAIGLAIGGGRVFATGSKKPLHCLDYATGVLRWKVDTASIGRAMLLLDEGYLYVYRGGTLECFGVEDGQRRWADGLKGFGYGSASLAVPGQVVNADVTG
jgi:outer membrane protein assembly factor BamB